MIKNFRQHNPGVGGRNFSRWNCSIAIGNQLKSVEWASSKGTSSGICTRDEHTTVLDSCHNLNIQIRENRWRSSPKRPRATSALAAFRASLPVIHWLVPCCLLVGVPSAFQWAASAAESWLELFAAFSMAFEIWTERIPSGQWLKGLHTRPGHSSCRSTLFWIYRRSIRCRQQLNKLNQQALVVRCRACIAAFDRPSSALHPLEGASEQPLGRRCSSPTVYWRSSLSLFTEWTLQVKRFFYKKVNMHNFVDKRWWSGRKNCKLPWCLSSHTLETH